MPELLAKRVSNYELFFDLAFVLGISQLTSSIHLSHVGVQEIFSFIISNIILLNLWMTEVFYYNKYGDSRRDDIWTVLIYLIPNIFPVLTKGKTYAISHNNYLTNKTFTAQPKTAS
ncbi:low temperature requirement A protein (LtrA) [Streptococcus gallolyticus]|nr:low temperature requirement A protein (LtrA) [Streptococcus gallolyticus]SDL16229.1 low temperature requirement A protein (LtrA) [Streptococcus gallolyticus]